MLFSGIVVSLSIEKKEITKSSIYLIHKIMSIEIITTVFLSLLIISSLAVIAPLVKKAFSK